MRSISATVLGLLGLSLVSVSAGLGHDWHLPLVGPPSPSPSGESSALRFFSVATQTDGRRRSLALTLTDAHVLAALDPASGAILWRRQYSPAARPTAVFLCGETITLVAPTGTSSLAARSGAVRWTFDSDTHPGSTHPGAVDALCWDPATADVVTLLNGEVRSVNGATGQLTWSKSSDSQHPLRLARLSDSQLAVIAQDGPTLTSQLLYIATGLPLSSISLRATAENSALAVVPSKDGVWGPTLVWLSAGTLKATLHGVTFSAVSTFSDGAKFVRILDVGLRDQGIFVARREDGSAVVFGAETGTIKSLWNFHEAAASSLFSGFVDRNGDDHVALLTFSSSLGLGNLQVLSLKPTLASSTGMVTGHTFPFKSSTFGSFRTFSVEVSPQSEYVVATRAIIGTDRGVVQLWTSAKHMWTREEGLATIDVRPAFVDPPERAHLGDLAEAHSGFSDRITRHMTAIQHRFSGQAVQDAVVPGQHEELIVLASSSARSIYAIDAAKNGSLTWRASPPLDADSTFAWRRVQVVAGTDGKSVVAATAEVSGAGEKTTTRVFYFDAFSGALFGDEASAGISAPTVGPPVTTVEHNGQRLVGQKVFGGHTETIWTFTPPAGEELVLVVPQQLGAVASLGRVLGDRSTLLKYLNPHLAAAVTIQPASRTAIIYLVDTASGALVHKMNLVGEVDPTSSDVHLVLRDNWLLASYRVAGDAARTTKIVSAELYQPDDARSTAASSLRSQTQGVRVLSRSFASPLELNVVGVTRTQLGIATYNAIFINGMGQVVTIPRRVLDPRRTFDKPTKDDQEEMLMQYEAVIPVQAQWTASHSYELLGVTHVASAPGRRESESLVLAFGHDLFFTRQSPSKSFDVLSPAFNKSQLVVTVTILSVALAVTRGMVQSRRIKQKWYSN